MGFSADTDRADLFAAAIDDVEHLVVAVLTVYAIVEKLTREAGEETAASSPSTCRSRSRPWTQDARFDGLPGVRCFAKT